MVDVSLLITTRNRLPELKLTLFSISHLLEKGLKVLIFDDGSSDGTYSFLQEQYPGVKAFRNDHSKGYLFCRNKLLNLVDTEFAISLDDDANFATKDSIPVIDSHFKSEKSCGVIAFKIYWGREVPENKYLNEGFVRVQSFVGCGHAWRMSAWRDIPDYPEWFKFYGEEDFASYHLFKKQWEIHYLPKILVHHRVEIKQRKWDKDYITRSKNSLRSGWHIFFLFYPVDQGIKSFLYSILMQFKKIFRGNWKTLLVVPVALFDLLSSTIKIISNRSPLTIKQFREFQKIAPAKIFWEPNEINEKN